MAIHGSSTRADSVSRVSAKKVRLSLKLTRPLVQGSQFQRRTCALHRQSAKADPRRCQTFLESMPTPEALLPAVDVALLETKLLRPSSRNRYQLGEE